MFCGCSQSKMGVKHAFADFTPILDIRISGVKHAFADFTPGVVAHPPSRRRTNWESRHLGGDCVHGV